MKMKISRRLFDGGGCEMEGGRREKTKAQLDPHDLVPHTPPKSSLGHSFAGVQKSKKMKEGGVKGGEGGRRGEKRVCPKALTQTDTSNTGYVVQQF